MRGFVIWPHRRLRFGCGVNRSITRPFYVLWRGNSQHSRVLYINVFGAHLTISISWYPPNYPYLAPRA